MHCRQVSGALSIQIFIFFMLWRECKFFAIVSFGVQLQYHYYNKIIWHCHVILLLKIEGEREC